MSDYDNKITRHLCVTTAWSFMEERVFYVVILKSNSTSPASMSPKRVFERIISENRKKRANLFSTIVLIGPWVLFPSPDPTVHIN